MQDKDFLSQFSTNNKPDSFKEEERIPINNKPKQINKKVIIIGAICLVVVLAVLFIIFFMPHINVVNFEGQTKEDAVAWLKQQEIETTGIVFKEEYDFENDKGIIISQEPNDGKVKKKAIMTFVVSGGPDPDEMIVVPDLASMDKDEITSWIKTNKLLQTKINSTYDDNIEEGEFIEAKYSGCEQDSFTRGCSLKISVSKGRKPEDEIVMVNYVKKTYAEFESWANSKKLVLNKTEEYSDTIEAGVVISQSVKENEKVKVGDTINVLVSKGKGVKVPDFKKMTDSEVDSWILDNSAYLKVKKKHFESGDYVIEQSSKTGQFIGSDNIMNITINLGSHFYLDELDFTIVGGSYDKLKDNTISWYEDLGINIDTHKDYVDSDKPEGTIVSIKDIYNGSYHYSEVQRLPLEIDIRVEVSNGGGSNTPSTVYTFNPADFNNEKLGVLLQWENISDIKLVYVDADGKEISEDPNMTVKEIKYDGESKNSEFYITAGTTLVVVLEDN